jgi:hypothetical protein
MRGTSDKKTADGSGNTAKTIPLGCFLELAVRFQAPWATPASDEPRSAIDAQAHRCGSGISSSTNILECLAQLGLRVHAEATYKERSSPLPTTGSASVLEDGPVFGTSVRLRLSLGSMMGPTTTTKYRATILGHRMPVARQLSYPSFASG